MRRVDEKRRIGRATGFCLAAMALLAWPIVAAAAPHEDLLPRETVFYLSVISLDKLVAASNESDWAKLWADPKAKELTGGMQQSVVKIRAEIERRLGFTWQELEPLAHNEISIALVQPPKQPASLVLLVDIKGQEKKAAEVLAAAAKRLQAKGAKRTVIAKSNIISLENPATKGAIAQKRFHLLNGDKLLAAETQAALESVLAGWGKKDATRLAELPAFRGAMKATRKDDAVSSQVNWFIDPFGYADAIAPLPAPTAAKTRPTLMTHLRAEGFEAIRGIGGVAGFTKGEYDVTHRMCVFAPPPYTKAMQAVKFSGPANDKPPAFAPTSLSGATSISWNVSNFFKYCNGLVDRMVFDGDMGSWEDTVKGIRDEPTGPRVDLIDKFVPALTDRVCVLSAESEFESDPRPTIYCVETRNEAAVAEMLQRLSEKSDESKKTMIGKHVVWESIEGVVDPVQKKKNAKGNQGGGKAAGGSMSKIAATCVFDGWLIMATDMKFLESILVPDKFLPLDQEQSFLRVSQHLDQLGAKQAPGRRFAQPEQYAHLFQRSARTLEVTPGKPIVEAIMNSLRRPKKAAAAVKPAEAKKGDDKKGDAKKGSDKKGDAKKADDKRGSDRDGDAKKGGDKPAAKDDRPAAGPKPLDAAVIRALLGPAGAVIEDLSEGWLISGFMLRHAGK